MARRRASNKAIGYIRLSPKEEGESKRQGLSPAAQRAAIERYCAAHTLKLVAVFEDLDVSGGWELEKRPALLQSIDALKELGADHLVVHRRDRLARDTMYAAMITRLVEKVGARVHAAEGAPNGDSPEDRLMRTFLDAFAEYEKHLIRQRTKSALAVKALRGERVGGIPYGYRLRDAEEVPAVLEEDPKEQKAVAEILRLQGEGLSIAKVADHLNKNAGRFPARGAMWHLTTVARVLQRAEERP
jgi:DNA invertase Pin-like site-specific DNA recombinase